MFDAYGHLDGREWLEGRLQNVRAQGFVGWHGNDLIAETQNAVFFRHLPALDVLVVGLIAFALLPRRDRGLTPKALVAYAVVAWALWTIVMFRGDTTAIQHGSYTTFVLLMMGGAIGLAGWNRIGAVLLVLHVAIFAATWLVPRAGIPVLEWRPDAAIVVLAATAASIMLVGLWRDSTTRTIAGAESIVTVRP